MNNNTVAIPVLNLKFMSDEEWNRTAIRHNTAAFIRETGKLPKNYAEVKQWVDEAVKKAKGI